jgi:hypothetical protein
MLEDKCTMSTEDDPVEGRGAMTMAVGSVVIFVLTVLFVLVASH